MCDEVLLFSFDTEIKKINVSSRSGIIEKALSILVNGGGTDITLPLRMMLQNKIQADRIIILSDNEINCRYGNKNDTCQKYADEYRRKINKNFWVHAIDLQGYGTQQFIGTRTNVIAGWSEKVLEFIFFAEQGLSTQVKTIKNYNIN